MAGLKGAARAAGARIPAEFQRAYLVCLLYNACRDSYFNSAIKKGDVRAPRLVVQRWPDTFAGDTPLRREELRNPTVAGVKSSETIFKTRK